MADVALYEAKKSARLVLLLPSRMNEACALGSNWSETCAGPRRRRVRTALSADRQSPTTAGSSPSRRCCAGVIPIAGRSRRPSSSRSRRTWASSSHWASGCCERRATRPRHGPPNRVAVNVSTIQLCDRNFVATVTDATRTACLQPGRLEIEVTELVFIDNTAAILATLKELLDYGVQTAIDDFGTGFSSLSYLLTFPFGRIKIDRAFIAGLPDKKESRAIVRAVSQLAEPRHWRDRRRRRDRTAIATCPTPRLHRNAGIPVQPSTTGRGAAQALRATRRREDGELATGSSPPIAGRTCEATGLTGIETSRHCG